MQNPKAIFFDLDDTILSFEGVAYEAWSRCTEEFVQKYRLDIDARALLNKINATRKWYWSDSERHKAGRMDLLQARRRIVAIALGELGDTLTRI